MYKPKMTISQKLALPLTEEVIHRHSLKEWRSLAYQTPWQDQYHREGNVVFTQKTALMRRKQIIRVLKGDEPNRMPRKYTVVSPEYVRKNYSYNETTGEFKNLRTGHIYYTDTEFNQSVYKRVKIKGHLFQLHILIYAWMTNQWPKGEVCFLRGVSYEWSNLVELSKEEAGRRNAYIQVSGAKELMCGGNFDMLLINDNYFSRPTTIKIPYPSF